MAGADTHLATGWRALEHARVNQARDAFLAAAEAGAGASALEGLAWVAWWEGEADPLIDARRRAYRALTDEGRLRDAALAAAWLATDVADFTGDLAVSRGWLRRARRLLADEGDCAEAGWVSVHEAEKLLLYEGGVARAAELGSEAERLGRQHDDSDLATMGMAIAGLAAVMGGDLASGSDLLDEAAATALGGDVVHPWATYWSVCLLIHGCEMVRDHERAGQWCRALQDWATARSLDVFARSCRVHYAGVLTWRGRWSDAEQALVDAIERLTEDRPPWTVEGWVRLGELRRRQGRIDEAERCFARCEGHPLAVLGSASLRRDRGDPHGALEHAEAYLRDTPIDAVGLRVAGLEVMVRCLLDVGQVEQAAEVCGELERLVSLVSTDALVAAATHCRGLLAASSGEPDAARALLDDAIRRYQRVGAPFETALARRELADVLCSLGRLDEAEQLQAAADEATRALGRVDHPATPAAEPPSPTHLTSREREVLRLVAEGQTNREVAGTLTLSEHTVNRHVTNILTKLGVSSRAAAVAEAIRHGQL